MRTIRDLEPGEQLLVSYGNDYWKQEPGVPRQMVAASSVPLLKDNDCDSEPDEDDGVESGVEESDSDFQEVPPPAKKVRTSARTNTHTHTDSERSRVTS